MGGGSRLDSYIAIYLVHETVNNRSRSSSLKGAMNLIFVPIAQCAHLGSPRVDTSVFAATIVEIKAIKNRFKSLFYPVRYRGIPCRLLSYV